MIEKLFRGRKAEQKPYYQQFTPEIDWEWMLVLGVIIGAFISANLSGQFGAKWVPERWAEAFGAVPAIRWFAALVGGGLMGLGSRWAGGCTSGHGISGTLQLAVSGWLAVISFFASGVAAAMFIYKIIGG
jgi:uncharacterized membrane protein YedE/YeeE